MGWFLKAIVALMLFSPSAQAATGWVVNNGNLTTAGTLYGCRLQAGQVSNCELNVSGSTLTISGDGGVALSATNKCQVGIRSNTAGDVACATFTANVTTTFGATSDTDGNVMGITSTANWASTMPMFLGVIYNGTTPYFTISRLPYVVSGAADTALWQEGSTDGDAQLDVGILTSGLTLASWVNLPITQVGWFDATYASTGEAWTFDVTGKNGFNTNYESSYFSMPLAQNGAATGTFMLANGGTAPLFTTNTYYYTVEKNGMVTISVYLDADPGTDGAGAVNARLALPLANEATFAAGGTLAPFYIKGATTVTDQYCVGETFYGISYVSFYYNSTLATVQSPITNAMFSNGARRMYGALRYKAF